MSVWDLFKRKKKKPEKVDPAANLNQETEAKPAAEKAELETQEKVEREAREKAEREAHEKAERFIPVALEVLAQDSSEISFGTSGKRAVIVRQVEMSDTMIECILNHVGCHIEIVHTTEVVPQPQRD